LQALLWPGERTERTTNQSQRREPKKFGVKEINGVTEAVKNTLHVRRAQPKPFPHEVNPVRKNKKKIPLPLKRKGDWKKSIKSNHPKTPKRTSSVKTLDKKI